MTLIYDGLHRLHLGFEERGDVESCRTTGGRVHTELLFDNKDTDYLAMFLYPRACSIVAERTVALKQAPPTAQAVQAGMPCEQQSLPKLR